MSSADSPDLARLERLLYACRRGLNHDLTNQLVALRGLLQLLQHDEAARLSPAGNEYIDRLLAVSQRTQALAHTLRDLSRLGGPPPPSEMVALPALVEEVVAELKPLPPCTYAWAAPRTFAPRPLLRQAVALALTLLTELDAHAGSPLDFRSHLAGPAVELAFGVGSLADTSRPAPSARAVGDLPSAWHDRLECALLRELATAWEGAVRWQKRPGGAKVILAVPLPQ
jgi:hypothetical protein